MIRLLSIQQVCTRLIKLTVDKEFEMNVRP